MKRYEEVKRNNINFYNLFSYICLDEYNSVVKPAIKGGDAMLRGAYFCLYSFLDDDNKPTKMKGEQLELFLSGETVFDRMLE
jgi:hypothetical protein